VAAGPDEIRILNRGLTILPEIVKAARPWSFSMTAISVTLGGLLALQAGFFALDLFALVLAGMILAHAAANLLNDYFDVKDGVDTSDAPTARYRRHPILSGIFTPSQILVAAALCFVLAMAAGIVLTAWRGWPIVVLAAAGGLAGYFYTGGPLKYKHHALGEVLVFLMWGPLAVFGAYYVQTQQLGGLPTVFLVSVPQGLWVALVLFANNLKDIEFDRRTGVKTLANGLGRKRSLRLYGATAALIYVSVVVEAALGIMPLWSLLVLLSVPVTVQLFVTLTRTEEIPPDADPRTARAAMIFGGLLLVSYALEHFVPLS
jgi:1,4-dihydroxy-2-naphthoate octaprenyltransferase